MHATHSFIFSPKFQAVDGDNENGNSLNNESRDIFNALPKVASVKNAIINLFKYNELREYAKYEYINYFQTMGTALYLALGDMKRQAIGDIVFGPYTMDHAKAEYIILEKYKKKMAELQKWVAGSFKKFEPKIHAAINTSGKTAAQKSGSWQSVMATLANARKEYLKYWKKFSADPFDA